MEEGRDPQSLTPAQIMSASKTLNSPGFAGVYEDHLSLQEVLLVVDCKAEIGMIEAFGRRRAVVAALTAEQVVVVGRVSIGLWPRRPPRLRVWKVDLRAIVALRVTPRGDLNIVYREFGRTLTLNLLLRDWAKTDRWMLAIESAFWRPR